MAQRTRFTKSGRKRHISMHRVRAAMHHGLIIEADEERKSVFFTGRDTSGRLLHVGVFEARESDQILLVFHALPLEWKR